MEIKNKMQEVEIEKMVVNCGGIDEKLERSVKLIKILTGREVCMRKSRKRIPDFGISPGKLSGAKVTIRERKEIDSLLKRFLSALDNRISKKQVVENHVSFGIREYIEVPGMEYNRDIGMLGFEITVVFKRRGRRVKLKKIKRGKYPKRQSVQKEEIIEFLKKNYKAVIY